MTRRRRAGMIVVAAAILAAGGGGWWWSHRPAAAMPVLYGNVDVRQLDLAFRVEGRLAHLLVEEGDHVAVGRKVADLDKGYLEDMLHVAEARAAASQANYDKLQAGYRPQEVAQARADVARAEAAYTNAKEIYDRRTSVTLDSAVSRQAVDNARADLRQTEAQFNRAKQALNLAQTGYRAEDIAAAKAQAGVDRGLLDLARRRLNDADLVSPVDGVVLTRVREPGSMLAPGTTVLSLALTSPMQVRTWVPEALLGKVVPGSRMDIAADSAPGHVYHGQVGFVSPVAEFTPKSVETPELRTSLVYRVRVVVSDPDERLRQGMPVTLRFAR
ncbi:MAG: efflux RND transporter periplasmic adaptor subunit [Magnetospirillum sp.]|nr:efflux RND transporter periplasmic adaptor subunit [Magnetospirillum sp.]